jgi:predicted acyltransferase (DUF342 family)
MRGTHTRRTVLGAIGGTIALGSWSGAVGAQEAPPTYQERADYWEVSPEAAERVITTDGGGVGSEGDVVVARGVAVDGGIDAARHVFLGDGVTVTGPVEAGGAVVTGSIVDLDGGVDAGDDVLLGVDILRAKAAYDAGELSTIVQLPIGKGVFTEDDVASAGDVVVGPWGDVGGSATAGRESDEGDSDATDASGGAETTAETHAEERGRPLGVILGTQVVVEEDVTAPGVVVVGSDGDIGGDITAGPLVFFGDSVLVGGGITVDRIERGERADVFDEPDGER